MGRLIDVTVIVACYNERNSIASFLESCLSQTVRAREFIIVDGGSSDGTIDIVREFSTENTDINIRLVVDVQCSRAFSKGPIAKARNIAINLAETDWIVSVDCGCIFGTDWLEAITRPIISGSTLDVVYGVSLARDRFPFQKKFAAVFLSDDAGDKNFLPSSRNLAFRKACWIAVGGYPEQTYTAEDTVFVRRLRAKGYKFRFAPDAVMYWDCPTTLHEAHKKYYLYAVGEGWYFYAPIKYFFIAVFCFFPVNFIFISRHRAAPLLVYTTNWFRFAGYCVGMCARLKGVFSGLPS